MFHFFSQIPNNPVVIYRVNFDNWIYRLTDADLIIIIHVLKS
jgi:hypothetical protein